MPSGWAAAVALYGVSLSQGKVGKRSETADTGSGSLSGTYEPVTANASAPYGDQRVIGPYGTEAARSAGRSYWFCGGSAATKGWSRSISPSLLAPPGEPSSSKNSTFAL
ncbi:hypothetical protein GCM10010104_56210 [Streptomyces indiaensis]|uniref:Secreted protein n=1 Tax=Streptomyces indiaensis TaxID=284033 RepID=A0ABN3E9M0_9ACTN